jgi:peptidoglycan hydrolase-like protein with peptidoglycan-binding domain
MEITFEQLTHMRDNLDGLGYAMGPRGLFGTGNEAGAFDPTALGGGSITANSSLRSLAVFDAYTSAAIFQFQRDSGMAATGQFGPDLQARVERTVRNLQNNLKLVLKKTDTDLLSGYYGLKTFQYMKEYQRLRNLPVTGIATAALQKQLNDDARQVSPGAPAPTAPPTPSDGQAIVARLSEVKGMFERGTLSKDGFIDEVRRIIP